MQPLITIETVPISIEYVEKEPERRSRSSSVRPSQPPQASQTAQTAKLRISQDTNHLTIQSNPISIPVKDTFVRDSDGLNSMSYTYTATAQYSKDGKLRMNVRLENPDQKDYQFKQFNRGIEQIADSLPKVSESAFQLEDMQINFDMSYLQGGSRGIDNLDTSFMPPDLELKIVEMPKVIVKYVGGPIYIPRSADPNYKAPEYQEQVFDGKGALDAKA